MSYFNQVSYAIKIKNYLISCFDFVYSHLHSIIIHFFNLNINIYI
jgi:hypothetical protein